MNMGSMDMSSSTSTSSSNSSMMDMSMMMMVFFTSDSTPLFAANWIPAAVGQYVGTCIFLIALTVAFRGLVTFRTIMEERWLDEECNRRQVIRLDRSDSHEDVSVEKEKDRAVLSANGVEEDIVIVARKPSTIRPWRLKVDVPRAVLNTIIGGVGYLIMIAVMTMNVGYFLSVLGGVFLGSLALGRYGSSGLH